MNCTGLTSRGKRQLKHATLPSEHPLNQTPACLFKADDRSRVWLAHRSDGSACVVKLFVFSRWRQRLLSWLGHHPGHNEKIRHAQLYKQGIAAIQINETGQAHGEHWLITPYRGLSLHNWLKTQAAHAHQPVRRDLAFEFGALTGQLLNKRYFFRDHKVSNMIVDDEHQLWLIDAGTVRRTWGRGLNRGAVRMIRQAHETAIKAFQSCEDPSPTSLTRTDQLRFIRGLQHAWPTCPPAVLREVGFELSTKSQTT